MAARISSRYVSRRLSSGGKMLSEKKKAAENVYIKSFGQPGRAGRACGWDRSFFFGQLFRRLGSPLCLPVFPFVCPPSKVRPALPVAM
ncbi:hypothetical protein AQUCO_05000031v1 [Aquilegia coerulea]|uniref:Uncharacterized protein n=1 Tax=Aquilegia coerulea TaxID=218851 RepID=A0A2G5CJ83_AQUCA|nr:hypothetical protein AQUCO_05000031v1 [Aquilegia coerulea]